MPFLVSAASRPALAVAPIVTVLGSLALLGSLTPQAAGADWPQWRGPSLTGVSVETGWSPIARPEPLWTAQLGLGHSSFAIRDGRVYTLGYDVDAGRDTVVCFDAQTGAEHWRHEYASEIWDQAHDGGTLTTPTIVDDVVYTSNREGKVFCLDADSGRVRWARDLRDEKGLEPPTWGFSASPLVIDGRVIMNYDRVVALDRNTGDDVWVTEREYGITYATPAPFELEGRACLASLSGDGLVVLDRATGDELAFYDWVKNPQIYPATPVVIGDRIFISAGYDRGCAMLRFDGTALHELWAGRVMRTKMSGCVYYDDHLFGFDESILKCIDLDGNEVWRRRGLGTGSMSIVGGRLLILDGKGQFIVAEASAEGYIELSRRKVLDDGTYWSTPVLSDGLVYGRNSLGQMVCMDHRGDLVGPVAATTESAGLPTANAVIARHVAAVGGSDALGRVRAVRMSGSGESLRNTVREGKVTMSWSADAGFIWKDEFGFTFGHDGSIGWLLGPNERPLVLEGDALSAIREAGDITRLFDPAGAYAQLGAVTETVFDNRSCHAIAATTPEGYERTLYFDRATGLYAGHDGEGIHLWTVTDYREFNGIRLPVRWAFFEPIRGEMDLAVFDDVELDVAFEPEVFAVPWIVRQFTRAPEVVARDEARLQREHAAILGRWLPSPADSASFTIALEVREGFLVLRQDEDEELDYLHEPDDDGRMAMVGREYVQIEPVHDDDDNVEAIRIVIGGEPRYRFERSSEP